MSALLRGRYSGRLRVVRLAPVLALAGVLLAGCGAGSPPAPRTPPVVTVPVTVGSAPPVRAEVADTEAERETGLMDRTVVPPGTGMVFRWDTPSRDKFYMFHTRVPLTAVFASAGRVVGVYEMAPCPSEQPQTCPLYGPDAAYDAVLETAPETVRGRVRVGDAFNDPQR